MNDLHGEMESSKESPGNKGAKDKLHERNNKEPPLLDDNFEIGRIDARHTTLDGKETTMTFDIRLKPGKWDKKYYHDPKE